MMKGLLPLGSIEVSKNGPTLMIDGYGMSNSVDEKVYDYSGVIFPIGLDVKELQLFNKNDIKNVVFMGYQTSKSIQYRKYMDQYVTDVKNGVPIAEAEKKLMDSLK